VGLAQWFSDFCSEIQVRDRRTIATRYQTITQRLNTDFWSTNSHTSHSLYVGSYGRNTAIAGFSDLDMVFELPSSTYYQYDGYSGNGQSALLQAVRASMARTYSTSSIGGNGQVVTVSFTDGITFEVLPVFLSKAGSYIHPDSNRGGAWRITNPRPEIQAIRDKNRASNENLINLCRMMRAWRRTWRVPIGGLLIDTLAYQFIGGWSHRHKSYIFYDWMCRDFLLFLGSQDKTKQYWRAPGSGQHVYRKGQFEAKASKCYDLALRAIEHESKTPKQEWSARQKWREIFGSSFPS